MIIQVGKSSLPPTSFIIMQTENLKWNHLTLEVFIQHCFPWSLLAQWTSFLLSLYSISSFLWEVFTTAWCEVRLKQQISCHRTVEFIWWLLINFLWCRSEILLHKRKYHSLKWKRDVGISHYEKQDAFTETRKTWKRKLCFWRPEGL